MNLNDIVYKINCKEDLIKFLEQLILNFKNNSNSINVNKANEYVFGKLSELLNNDKLIKDIVANINKTRKGKD